MAWSIRRLDADRDAQLYETMYTWLDQSPSWRRETEAIFGTVDRTAYLGATKSPGRCDIGIFEEGELVATVILTLTAHNTYEVHFEASSGVSKQTVIEAGQAIKAVMFGRYGADLVYTWTPRWNRTVIAINRAIGFKPDNVTMLHGTCRGRLVEWVRYSITRSTNGRN